MAGNSDLSNSTPKLPRRGCEGDCRIGGRSTKRKMSFSMFPFTIPIPTALARHPTIPTMTAYLLLLSSPLSIVSLHSRAASLPGSSQSLASDPPKGRVKQGASPSQCKAGKNGRSRLCLTLPARGRLWQDRSWSCGTRLNRVAKMVDNLRDRFEQPLGTGDAGFED